MSIKTPTRDDMAAWYAKRHLETDPGIRDVYYLSADAPAEEIRLVEVNELIAVLDKAPLEPIDFGVDVGGAAAHRLMVLDVTPSQWDQISSGKLPLPATWSLAGAAHFGRPHHV